jgi:hypothetical protein
MHSDDIKAVAEFCKAKLALANARLPDQYSYQSLPLCVIDAVFSIGVNYISTRNTVTRFCKYFGINQINKIRPPAIADQLSITEFINLYNQYGVEVMAERVYQNLQRTSTRNGISKSEAVLRFSQALLRFGVDYFQDVNKILGNPSFESVIRRIPGQGSGLSLWYFYMLAGSDNYVKPDRMITRFILSATGKSLSIEESQTAVVGACEILVEDYPHLTPRMLDHLIWEYQRKQKWAGTRANTRL